MDTQEIHWILLCHISSYALHDNKLLLGSALLKFRLLIYPFEMPLISRKYLVYLLNHVHIWQNITNTTKYNKYWCRLLKLPIDNPLHIVYKKLIQLHTLNRNWCSVVFDILQSLGFENVLEAQTDINVADIDRFNSKLKLSLQNSYADYWRNEIRNINKHPIPRTYSLFKAVHVSATCL